jgi:hypothetical protein
MNKFFLRVSFAVTLFAISFSLVSAQETSMMRFGVKGGVNVSTLFTEDADSKGLIGFNLGVFAKFPIVKEISVQPELYYTTKGATVTYDNAFVDGKGKFQLNYLELPLLVVVNVTENVNIHAGPYVSYLITGKVKNESDVVIFNFEDNIDTDDYNRTEAGLAAGLGADIGTFSVGGRYYYGLTKVGKERTFLGTTYTFPDAKNSVLSFYIAVSLN